MQPVGLTAIGYKVAINRPRREPTERRNQRFPLVFLQLPGEDSNLYKENQNLLCYHYTTG
jgi:hypothetical protein